MQDYTDHLELLHLAAAPAAPARAPGHAPAINRTSINEGCTPAQWADFLTHWETFCRATQLVTDDQRSAHFVACLSKELQSKMGRTNENFATLAWDPLVDLARSLAVSPVAVGRLRDDAMGAVQQPGERIRPFYLRCKGMGLDCEFHLVWPKIRR